jgi:hypothetical protein
MSNQWLNVHKSTAAMNYFFSNMTSTVIFMTLGDLRIRHTIPVIKSTLYTHKTVSIIFTLLVKLINYFHGLQFIRTKGISLILRKLNIGLVHF